MARKYIVLDREEAIAIGAKPTSNSDANRHALVSVNDGALDVCIAWGFKADNLQSIADKRNADLEMLGRMVKGTSAKIDAIALVVS